MDRAESAESNRNRASIFERFAGLTHDGLELELKLKIAFFLLVYKICNLAS